MKIAINCPYCDGALSFTHAAHATTDSQSKIATLKCSHCGSTIGVHLHLKRERHGAGYRAMVARRKAEHEAAYVKRQEENETIGAKLLAEPGCTCVAEIERNRERFGREGRSMGRAGDHPLVTSWSNGLPNAPQHFHQCPRRKKEAA